MVTYALHKFSKRQDGGVTGHGYPKDRIWLSRSARALQSRRIFRDNSFTSLKLVCDLLRDETYICETICLNRLGFQNGVSPQNAAVLNLTKRQIEIL